MYRTAQNKTAKPLGRARFFAAFTLIELMVVIAIIAILAALLFPVLASAKKKALRIQCVNNLKQMALAINLYADDHGDSLPGPVWQGLYHVYDNSNTLLMPYYIATYCAQAAPTPDVQVLKMALCPASVRTWQAQPQFNLTTNLGQPISYIVSIAVTNTTNDLITRPFGYPFGALPPGAPDSGLPNEGVKHLRDIRNTSASMAIEDTDQENANPLGGYYAYIPETPIHGSVRNELFFDWHVEQIKAEPPP